MAYQPESFNKFMTTAATATLVVTAVAPVAMASSFTDVAPKYREAVDFVVAKGAEGITDTKFGVHENIKRVDAAVLLVKVLDLDYENAQASGFTDVPERAVKYVNALKEAGITSGKTKTKFDPHSLITRGELAVWIQKGFELMAKKDVPFTDVANQYKEAVAALVDNNVTKGISATKFGTYQNAKRGDYAVLLMKAFNAAFEPIISSSITLHEVTPLEGAAAIVTEDQGVELPYTLLDQYDSEVLFDAHEANNMNDEDIEIIEGVEFTSTNPEVIDIDTLAVDKDGVVTLNVGSQAGTTEIMAKIPKTNSVSKVKVTVFEMENAEEIMNTAGEYTGNLMVKPTGEAAITYGPAGGTRKVNGNLIIDGSANGTVNLRNIHVNGKVIVNAPNAKVVMDATTVVNGQTTIKDVNMSGFASNATHNGDIVVIDTNGASLELAGKASAANVQIDTTGAVTLNGIYTGTVAVNKATTISVPKTAELKDLKLNQNAIVSGEGRIQEITGTGIPTIKGVTVVTGTYDNVAPKITDTAFHKNNDPQLIVDFKLSENVHLTMKSKGNIEIIYQGKNETGEYVEVYKEDKTFSGYLYSNNEANEEIKYGPGTLNESKYEAVLPINEQISTAVSGKEWMNDYPNLRVMIRVRDNAGNMSEQIVTAK